MPKGTALITGASMGIGRDLAHEFAKHGHAVLLVARSEGKLRELADQISTQYKVQAHVITQDLTDPNAAHTLYDQVQTLGISVDILVNNAGFASYGFFHELALKTQTDMIQLNVTTLTMLSHVFVKDMLARRSGKILNVASTAGFLPGPLMAVYYATKAYVLSFSEALNNELRDKGVSVTALCPGPTQSEFQARAAMQDSKLVQRNLMTSQAVAAQGYAALMAGESVRITGFSNKLLMFMRRFLPRDMITQMTRNAQERVGH